MRSALLLASSALLGYAAMPAPQEEPLAEKQFKNIQSFKGMKASDVIPAMEFMSASLKVECDFCHTDDRASEAKPEKQTTRMMIEMQRDINQKNFGGRNEVTCATCHGGREHPLSVPPVPGIENRARRSADVKPADVIAQFAKAAGEGPKTGLRLTGQSTQKGETAAIDALYLGEKFLIVRHTAKGDVKMGFNGSQVWYAAPGFSTVIPPEVAERFRYQNALFLSGDALPKLTNPGGGTAKLEDKDTVVLSGTVTGTKMRASLFVDKKDGRLLQSTFSHPTVLGTLAEINRYDKYRRVGGAQVPSVVVLHTGDGDETRRFTSIKEDAKIAAAAFEMPK